MSVSEDREPLLRANGSNRRYDDPSTMSDGQQLGADDAQPTAAVLATDAKLNGLRRDLSARQVSMIAIGGTIGTGLFLGTGRSLAQGGPARSVQLPLMTMLCSRELFLAY